MAQTAVEWFIEQLEKKGDLRETPAIRIVQINIDTSDYLDIKRQAKAMEKEQIINACESHADYPFEHKDFEEYYNETYTNRL